MERFIGRAALKLTTAGWVVIIEDTKLSWGHFNEDDNLEIKAFITFETIKTCLEGNLEEEVLLGILAMAGIPVTLYS